MTSSARHTAPRLHDPAPIIITFILQTMSKMKKTVKYKTRGIEVKIGNRFRLISLISSIEKKC